MRPSGTRHLVRQRHYRHIQRPALEQSTEPRRQALGPPPMGDHAARAVDEERSHIRVAALADRPRVNLAAGAAQARGKALANGVLPSVGVALGPRRELRCERARPQRSDPRNRQQPLR